MQRAPDEVVHNRVTVHLSWLDWLRVGFGRPLHVDTRQEIWVKGDGTDEVVVGRADSRAWVERLVPARDHGLAHEAAPPVPEEPDDRVAIARTEDDRLVAEGAEPYEAARALVMSLCWRTGTHVGGTVEFVTVEGTRYPITIEPTADGRCRASVAWPLAESG